MYDQLMLDVRAEEYRQGRMRDAELDRLLLEGRTARPSLAAALHRVASRLACLLGALRYRWLTRRGLAPLGEPCS